MFRASIVISLLSVATAQQPGQLERVETPQGWTAIVRAELAAQAVIRADLHIRDDAAFDDAMRRGGGYVPIVLKVKERLEGKVGQEIELTCFVAPEVHARGIRPTGEALRELNRREVLVLLEHIGRRWFLADRYSGHSLLLATPQNLRDVRSLVRLHDYLEDLPIPNDVPLVAETDAILDDIARDPKLEREGFQRIQNLGPKALAAVVRHLDDARPTNEPDVLIRSARSTGTRTVRALDFGEVLIAIVSEWSNQSFGIELEVFNRRARERRVECLRVFGHYVLANPETAAKPVERNQNR